MCTRSHHPNAQRATGRSAAERREPVQAVAPPDGGVAAGTTRLDVLVADGRVIMAIVPRRQPNGTVEYFFPCDDGITVVGCVSDASGGKMERAGLDIVTRKRMHGALYFAGRSIAFDWAVWSLLMPPAADDAADRL